MIIDSGCRGFIGPYPSAPLDEWVMQLSGYRSALFAVNDPSYARILT